MQGYQTQITNQPAQGVPGDRASQNPIRDVRRYRVPVVSSRPGRLEQKCDRLFRLGDAADRSERHWLRRDAIAGVWQRRRLCLQLDAGPQHGFPVRCRHGHSAGSPGRAGESGRFLGDQQRDDDGDDWSESLRDARHWSGELPRCRYDDCGGYGNHFRDRCLNILGHWFDLQ